MKKFEYPHLGETVFRETLPNGLPIAVVPRKGFTRKMAYLVVDYGSVHMRYKLGGEELYAPAGTAHYLEHKMFDLPGRDVAAEFAALGASPNAFTSYDLTAYYFSGTEHFEECLKLLLEFVNTPYFTPESVEKERGIIGQEIGMNVDDSGTQAFEQLLEGLYRENPIRVPILGTAESISQITDKTLYQCHRAHYVPGNMILCVVGDVEPETVCRIARENLPETAQPMGEKFPVPAESEEIPTPYTEKQMEVSMPTFQLGFRCRPEATGEASVRQEILGDLAAEALFGESSELYLKLYEEGLIDSSFGGGFETIDGAALLLCSGDSEDPKAVRTAILAQAEKLGKEGVDERDFLRMKRSAVGHRIRDLDSFDSVCYRLCACYFSNFDYFRFPEIYQSVTAEDIRNFLSQWVRKENCALSIIFPLSKTEA